MTPRNAQPGDWLSLERFDFSQVSEQMALVRLLARLEAGIESPRFAGLTTGQAQLIIDHGDLRTWSLYPARACRFERRLTASASRVPAGSELLWRASFAVPLVFVEAREAIFELTAGDHRTLVLPAPALRAATQRPLPLALRGHPEPSRLTVGQARQRVAALATVAALTASSGSGVALAAGVAGSDATGKVAPGAGDGKSVSAVKTSTSTAPAAAAKGRGPAPRPTPQASRQATTKPTTTSTVAAPGPKPRPTTTTTVAALRTTTTTVPTTTTTTTTTVPTTMTTTATTLPTTTTTTAAPTTTPRLTRPPRLVPRPAPRCHSRTRGDLLTVAAVHQKRYAKRSVGLSVDAPARNCTPTSAPKPGHLHPTPTRPRHGAHLRSGHPSVGRRHHERATGGAPLVPISAKQPRHTLSPTPSTSVPSSGGAAEHPVPTLSSSAPGFLAPSAWTGTVTADPSLTGAVRNLSGLLANGNRPPSFLIPIYMQAGKRYDIPWPVLAAINAIESDYGRNLNTSSAGAVGWMQFEPSTWHQYGVAADRHSNPNPYDPRDAIFAAARYLKAAGGSHDISKAVFAYNHAGWYVDEVMSRAQAIANHVQYERAKRNKRGTFSVFFATGVKRHPTVRYSGGVLSHYDRVIASANMVSAANFPYLYGGGHEQPARWGPFDCSGAVSYVMQQAGYKVQTTVSGDVPSWKFPAGPGRVTIFYNPVHTFMRIGNRYFGTSGFARPGGGAGWFNVDKLPAGYLSTFRVVHVPHLGVNSFARTNPRPAPSKSRHATRTKLRGADRS